MYWDLLQDSTREAKGLLSKIIFNSSLNKYSEISPGNLITNSKMPEWAKSFTSLIAHLVPMIGSMTAMDQLPIPKQIKSVIGLSLMYLGVWGNSKMDSLPKVAGITVASSMFSDLTHLPNFARRSLLALFLTAYQNFAGLNIMKLSTEDFIHLGKKLIPKLLEMELKINTSVPAAEYLGNKTSSPLKTAAIKILGISGIVTGITELLKATGLKTNDAHTDSTALGDMCPVCGEAHAAGECVAADIAPTLSNSTIAH